MPEFSPRTPKIGISMRGIAGEQHAAMAIALQRHRAGAVEARSRPARQAVAFADGVQVALHEGAHVLRLHRLFGVLAVAQLVVDAPDVVGLAVHQHGGAADCQGGSNQARRSVGWSLGSADVDDDVAAFVGRAFQRQAQRVAHEARPPSQATTQSAVQRVAAAQGVARLQRDALAPAASIASTAVAQRMSISRVPALARAIAPGSCPRCSTAAG